MENLNIYEILASFSKKELNLFGKFIRSPYFNNQTTLVRMFDFIKNYYPDFKSGEFNRKKIFEHISPDKRYNDALFRKYISNLTKLAEEFLIQRGNEAESEGGSIMLLEQYYRRKVNRLYEKTLKRIEKHLQSVLEIGEIDFLKRHMLEEIKINFEVMNERVPLKKELLFNSQYYIFNYFIMLTVNNVVELINYLPPASVIESRDIVASFIRNFNYEKFIEETGGLKKNQLLTLKMNYLDLSLAIKPGEPRYYFEMKELLRKNHSSLSINTLYLYLTKIINYCIHKVSGGEDSFTEEVFDNFDFALRLEKYKAKIKQNFSFLEFRNALLFSLELHHLKWTKWFVENFIEYVSIKKRQRVRDYADAFIAFEEKEFDRSLVHLSKIEYEHPVTKFDADLLLTKLYYELNYFEACYSLIDSLKHLVNNSAFLSDNVKTQYLNYLKLYKNLVDIKQGKNTREAGLLKDKISGEKMLKSSRWLIEKAEELLQN